jgi:NAD(P)H dehydrogenase (quinone)
MIEYLGMTALEPFVAYAAPRIDAEGRGVYLRQWSMRLQQVVEDVASHASIAAVTPTATGRS